MDCFFGCVLILLFFMGAGGKLRPVAFRSEKGNPGDFVSVSAKRPGKKEPHRGGAGIKESVFSIAEPYFGRAKKEVASVPLGKSQDPDGIELLCREWWLFSGKYR
ncbi:hypothetical protein OOT00_00905 [Desulfobotulus sp. H1]|uniref:Uncharacterized protein n=1 Tax=Desulfobotulus pelophilus TaxID=2823377 RepID=A0ABT3N500_9BACT|nr:hypothetical protein [Desulfobotulus pelophilus]MCW7752538.1 hypothetical protein [Desulfobotulus pelophilus]